MKKHLSASQKSSNLFVKNSPTCSGSPEVDEGRRERKRQRREEKEKRRREKKMKKAMLAVDIVTGRILLRPETDRIRTGRDPKSDLFLR